ncbi:hypothetical protein EHQ59_07680 [Leptospira kemamanensis]|uniref:Uncharacterized protein n=1 Tax=Leptospira kemamanensis TaxID=2484942 RepID=A0A4R9JTK8_9LEPT|nr:hypothetical protein EHQ59_07680 [Leptospira kemamanensis]
MTNLSERDGVITDPSLLYGISNEWKSRMIDQFDSSELIQDWAKTKIQSQRIPRNLFWIGIGVSQTF